MKDEECLTYYEVIMKQQELTKEDLQDEILSILFNYLLQENKQQEEIIKHILKLEVIRNDNSDTTS